MHRGAPACKCVYACVEDKHYSGCLCQMARVVSDSAEGQHAAHVVCSLDALCLTHGWCQAVGWYGVLTSDRLLMANAGRGKECKLMAMSVCSRLP